MEQVVLAIYFIGDLEGESSFERCFFFFPLGQLLTERFSHWIIWREGILIFSTSVACVRVMVNQFVTYSFIVLRPITYGHSYSACLVYPGLFLIGSLNCWLVGMEVFGVILQLLSGGLSLIVLCGLYGGSRTIGFLKGKSGLSLSWASSSYLCLSE